MVFFCKRVSYPSYFYHCSISHSIIVLFRKAIFLLRSENSLLTFIFCIRNILGELFSEGFDVLQKLYDRHNIPAGTGQLTSFSQNLAFKSFKLVNFTAKDWAVEKVVIRESAHAPYQFIFAESRIVPSGHRLGVVIKDMTLSGNFQILNWAYQA